MGVNEKLEALTNPNQVRQSKTKTMKIYTLLSQALQNGAKFVFEKWSCNVSCLEAFLYHVQWLPQGMLPEDLQIKNSSFAFTGLTVS